MDVAAGTLNHRLEGLQNEQVYYVALAAISNRGTPSERTDTLTATPTDGIAPAGILNLTAYIEAGLQLPVWVASSGDYGEDWDGGAAIDGNTNTAWSAPILAERMNMTYFSFDGNVTGAKFVFITRRVCSLFPASFDIETSRMVLTGDCCF